MNNSKQFARAFHRYYSQSATTAETAVGRKIQKLRETQRKFGIDDGTPVYIKSGISDKLLYHTTLALTAIGLGLSFETLYRITFKD
ncbi:hypothetical protein NQ314_018407 [Rhamnusium bicolor]|uniref:Uncharacterized protein n=1 Tax=Rhamnusium bicolor TaxID=1586634 RepID=A0AAV8WSG1_9CUCU|nr:hypothetical protein NQ314_018407 [Rhamnusium bicolor]